MIEIFRGGWRKATIRQREAQRSWVYSLCAGKTITLLIGALPRLRHTDHSSHTISTQAIRLPSVKECRRSAPSYRDS
jgi:hypothetical protein